jgi:hypothetical protein
MNMKLTGEDLARNMLESPRLRNFRYTERQLKFIESQWPEVGTEIRRRQAARQNEGRQDVTPPQQVLRRRRKGFVP